MATQTLAVSRGKVETFKLQISSARGPIDRDVLRSPIRDATDDEIPIIDVSGIFSSHFEERAAVAQKIHDAAMKEGFFYMKGHGISSEITNSAHQACLDFFRQDFEEKDKANAKQSAYFNGYKPLKSQRINPGESKDSREAFSWTYDPRWDPAVGDLKSVPKEVLKALRLEPDGSEGSEDDRFPWSETKAVPHFKTSVIAYWQSCLALARQLIRTFALSLDLKEDYFDDKFTHPDAALALNYYPPIEPESSASSSSGDEESEVSIGSHTDFQLFTMLWQDSNGGLQVLTRGGQWIYAKPIEGTFVVNIADFMQRITGDKYISTVHRAVNSSGKERVSMPCFIGLNSNVKCGVLPGCEGPDGKPKYEAMTGGEWVRLRVKAMHDTSPAKDK